VKYLLIWYVATNMSPVNHGACDGITDFFRYNNTNNPVPALVSSSGGAHQIMEFADEGQLWFMLRHEFLGQSARAIFMESATDSTRIVRFYEIKQFVKLDTLTHEFDEYGATLVQVSGD